METPKHEQPNITIGEQEFQKVGNMNSEPTDLKHAPKNYDLYQDTESGALVGKLPEHHPSYALHTESNESIEQKIENLDIDLTKLTFKEIDSILKSGVKMYGKYNTKQDGRSDFSYEGKFEIVISNNVEYIKIKDGGLIENARFLESELSKKFKNKILFDMRSLEVNKSNGTPIAESHLELSFYEMPDGLAELNEKKN